MPCSILAVCQRSGRTCYLNYYGKDGSIILLRNVRTQPTMYIPQQPGGVTCVCTPRLFSWHLHFLGYNYTLETNVFGTRYTRHDAHTINDLNLVQWGWSVILSLSHHTLLGPSADLVQWYHRSQLQNSTKTTVNQLAVSLVINANRFRIVVLWINIICAQASIVSLLKRHVNLRANRLFWKQSNMSQLPCRSIERNTTVLSYIKSQESHVFPTRVLHNAVFLKWWSVNSR